MINLLPYKEKRSIEKIRTIRLVTTSLFGFVCIVIVGMVLLIPTFITINSRYSITKKQISDLQKASSITTDVDLNSFGNRVRGVDSKLASTLGTQPTAYVDIIKGLVPKGVLVNQFSASSAPSVSVSGVVDNRETLQSFIKVLESDGRIAAVNSPVSNFIKSKNSDFMLTITFK